MSVPTRAQVLGVGRTMIFMSSWIMKYAPDVTDDLMAGVLKVTPVYKRLRRAYEEGLAQALATEPTAGRYRLVSYRRDGRFVFEWVQVEAAPRKRKKGTTG